MAEPMPAVEDVAADAGHEVHVEREWLVTNGIAGYASGTVAGIVTRRYHGLLVAALAAPLGRMLMWNHLTELLRLPDGTTVQFGGEERVGQKLELASAAYLRSFALEMGLPVWTFQIGEFTVEKRILLVHGQNTAHVRYRLLEGPGTLRLKLRPAVHFRPYEAPVDTVHHNHYLLTAHDTHLEVTAAPELPPLRFRIDASRPAFTIENAAVVEVLYRMEASRGYQHVGELWTPGYFRGDLSVDAPVTLVGSVEDWETIDSLSPPDAYAAELDRRAQLLTLARTDDGDGVATQLILAADQFIVSPGTRPEESTRAHAAGEEARTVIAGYHWFTDWGRDTMISLDGLTLATGRVREAGAILRTFARYVRNGLIPNMFPDDASEGLYHTADATLWFFHAVNRYVTETGDNSLAEQLLPTMRDIIQHHVRGTSFGIGVDPGDGLLRQGEPGYQLTWMDAKVNGWVVTPRRGKAVEINALWYNALRCAEQWSSAAGDDAGARDLAGHAERAYASFNSRFWYDDGGYLYDVVDGETGDDDACRPNQIFAIALPHPVLDPARWRPVLDIVTERLLTPVGLRSLAPGHADYRSVYEGDLPARDAAYHQGTVWGWLIGPFVDAWLKVYPDRTHDAREMLQGLVAHLDKFGVGSVAEIFDADPPHRPRGCIAQAWSVAELLRCWRRTAM